MGLFPSNFPEPVIDVWPENWEPIQLFLRYWTQWRMGFNGPVGLDYGPILHDLDRRNLTAERFDEMMDAIRLIESVAIDELTKD